MSNINHTGAVSARSVLRRCAPFAVVLLLAVGTASAVYCQASTAPDTPSVEAEAGGWRLAITQPAPGATSTSMTTICYEVTGTSREPELALEITPLAPGGAPASDTVRASISVGRSSVTADLGAAGEGTFDLRVQLVVDGTSAGRPAVTIHAVTLRQGVPPGACS